MFGTEKMRHPFYFQYVSPQYRRVFEIMKQKGSERIRIVEPCAHFLTYFARFRKLSVLPLASAACMTTDMCISESVRLKFNVCSSESDARTKSDRS
jgi:hypothetical protein